VTHLREPTCPLGSAPEPSPGDLHLPRGTAVLPGEEASVPREDEFCFVEVTLVLLAALTEATVRLGVPATLVGADRAGEEVG